MTIRSILLGTAAVSLIATSAYAADLPASAEPADYVQVCDAYGSGFFRLPGTDTCLRVGGDVRVKYNFHQLGAIGDKDTYDKERKAAEEAGGSGYWNTPTIQPYEKDSGDSEIGYSTRGRVFVDARTGTDWGPARAYAKFMGNAGGGSDDPVSVDDAFIQVGGFVAGRTGSSANLTYGSYANNANYGTYDPDNTLWLVGYSMDFGYGVVVSASVEKPIDGGLGFDSVNAKYKATSSHKMIPDVAVSAELAQGWGKVGVSGGFHMLQAEATELLDRADTPDKCESNITTYSKGDPKPTVDAVVRDMDFKAGSSSGCINATAEPSTDDPTDLTGFGFFGGGGVEVNVLSTTKVGATGFYAVGAMDRINAGMLPDAVVLSPGDVVNNSDAGPHRPERETDDELLTASGFSANGGLTHSFGSAVAFHANGGYFSVTNGQEISPTTHSGFFAGGSMDYKPISNLTFTVGGEFASLSTTIEKREVPPGRTAHGDYVDSVSTRNNFAFTAQVSRSF